MGEDGILEKFVSGTESRDGMGKDLTADERGGSRPVLGNPRKTQKRV